MKLSWSRPGVVVMTAKVEELALLIAAGRIAAAGMERESGEQAEALKRLLRDLDRSVVALHRTEASTSAVHET